MHSEPSPPHDTAPAHGTDTAAEPPGVQPAATAADKPKLEADPVDAAASAAPGAKRRGPAAPDLAAVAGELKARFPAVFGGTARPLKLRIQADVQARAPGVFTRQGLSAFLHRHTTSTNYLIALAQQPQRLDLDGQPAGEVAAEHRDAAAQEVERRRAQRKEREAQMQEARRAARQAERGHEGAARRQAPAPHGPQDAPRRPAPREPVAAHPDDAARRDRARLLRDFESSTLTKANFCALKGLTPAALEEQLAQARQDAAQRQAAHNREPAFATSPERPAPRRDERRGPGAGREPMPAHERGHAQRSTRPQRTPRAAPAAAPQPPRAPRPEAAPDLLVPATALQRVAQAILEQGGSSATEAAQVAQHLVEANLRGHDSHGVGMLPRYVRNLQAGTLRVNQSFVVRTDHGALLTLDGQAGYGQAIGVQAMQLGIERARLHGVAVIGLANTHHLGRIGAYAEQCLAAGLVSIHFVNVISRPHVAPFGGTDARFATNPMCVGIPLGEGNGPLVLDFATSRIALGKVRVALNRGKPVPHGALIDETGRPTRDPGTMFREPHGALLPFGGHKGYGLALVCEILAGALTGGLTLHELPTGEGIINNMLSFVVDPERLGTAAHLAQQARAFADWLKASPPAPDAAVLLPGDPERAHHAQRSAAGIPIDATTWAELVQAAGRLGLAEDTLRALAQPG